MKSIIIICFITCVVTALPIESDKPEIRVLKQDIVHKGDKGYQFDIETSDGSKHQEVGDFKYVGGLTVKGSYEYIDDNGQVRKVVYEADEKGFRPMIIE